MTTPYIIKYTNVLSRNNETGRGVTQYHICTKEDGDKYSTRWTKRITKSEAVESGLPIVVESMRLYTM